MPTYQLSPTFPLGAPPALPGQRLYLSADVFTGNDGDAIASWSDPTSGLAAVQATSGKRWLLRTGVNGINGLRALELDGVDDMATVTGLLDSSFDTSMMGFMVFERPAGQSSQRCILEAGGSGLAVAMSGALSTANRLLDANEASPRVTVQPNLSGQPPYFFGAPLADRVVLGWAYDGAEWRVSANGTEMAGITGPITASGALGLAGTLTLGAHANGSQPWLGKFSHVVFCNVVDLPAWRAELYRLWLKYGIPVPRLITGFGDSTMYGQTSHTPMRDAALALVNPGYTENHGIGGSTAAQWAGGQPFLAQTVSSYFRPDGVDIPVMLVGGNDATNATTVYGHIQTIVSNLRAAGADQVGVCTIPQRGAGIAYYDPLNDMIRAGAGSNYFVIDLYQIAGLSARLDRDGSSAVSAQTGGSLYSDTTHFTDAGSTAVGNKIAAVIEGLSGISAVADNRTDYAGSQIPARSKLEITCQITTVATALGYRYDAAPPSLVPAGVGISADIEVTNNNWATTYTQPMAYRPVMTHNVYGGLDHYYPTGAHQWFGRVSAPWAARGAWKYRIRVVDANGTVLSNEVAFTVVAPLSGNPGFVRVAQADDRYYEREDGSLLPAFGHNRSINSMPTTEAGLDSLFSQLGTNRVPIIRPWTATIGLVNSAENRWYGSPGANSKELLVILSNDGQTADVGSNSQFAWRLVNNDGIAPGDRALFAGFAPMPGIAVLPDTVYEIDVRYRIPTSLVSNDVNPAGLCVKTGGFLSNSYTTGTGTVLKSGSDGTSGSAVYATASTPTWATLTAYVKTGSTQHFLTGNNLYLYMVMENCSTASGGQVVYIDNIRVREQATGTDILFRSDADMDREVDEHVARWVDHMIDAAEANGVTLEPELWHAATDNMYAMLGAADGNGPAGLDGTDSLDAVRWRVLQTARQWGARWLYSPAIHNLELTNEGSPFSDAHARLTRLMGTQVRGYWTVHEYKTTTSTEHENTFWTTTGTRSRDIHQYMAEWVSPTQLTYASPVLTPGPGGTFPVGGPGASGFPNKWRSGYPCYHDIGNAIARNGTHGLPGPIMVGETGINVFRNPADQSAGVDTDTPQSMTSAAHDTKLHKIWWGTALHKSGIGILWWMGQDEVYDHVDGVPNRLPIWKRVRDFLDGVPLNNGHYQDALATASDANIVCVGQKDLVNGVASIWIDHRQHRWDTVDAGTPVTPISGATLTLPGFVPSRSYLCTFKDTYSPSLTTISTVTVQANGSGVLLVPLPTLSSDYVLSLSTPGGGGGPTITSPIIMQGLKSRELVSQGYVTTPLVGSVATQGLGTTALVGQGYHKTMFNGSVISQGLGTAYTVTGGYHALPPPPIANPVITQGLGSRLLAIQGYHGTHSGHRGRRGRFGFGLLARLGL